MKDKILLEALSMKGTNRRVMAYLLRHPPKAQIVSDGKQAYVWYKTKLINKNTRVKADLCIGALILMSLLPYLISS